MYCTVKIESKTDGDQVPFGMQLMTHIPRQGEELWMYGEDGRLQFWRVTNVVWLLRKQKSLRDLEISGTEVHLTVERQQPVDDGDTAAYLATERKTPR